MVKNRDQEFQKLKDAYEGKIRGLNQHLEEQFGRAESMAQQVEALQADEDENMTEIANLRAVIEQEGGDKKLLQENV